MADYIAIEKFNDRELGCEIPFGAPYPPEGRSVPESWIERLSTCANACGRPFIKPIQRTVEPEDAIADEAGDLKARAKELGVKGYGNMKPETLAQKIAEKEAALAE